MKISSQDDAKRIQFLRTLDKHDRIGTAGVVSLMQEEMPAGPGLDPVRAALVGVFLGCKGESSEDTLQNISGFFRRAAKVMPRLDMMVALDADSTRDDEGKTAWDRLLEMPVNVDNTWLHGGRPKNIAWALDDIVETVTRSPDDQT